MHDYSTALRRAYRNGGLRTLAVEAELARRGGLSAGERFALRWQITFGMLDLLRGAA